MDVSAKLEQFDDAQQRHRKVSIAVATFRKFQEDHTTNYAAMIAFWAFFSIFPLFLVLVTLLGFFLPDDMKQSVLAQVATYFPLLDTKQVGALSGSWWALIVGLGSALWSGSGVVRTVQFSFNSLWEVQDKDRPKFVEKLVRSLWVLATIGLGLVLSTLITGLVSGSSSSLDLGWVGRLVGYAIAIVLDIGLFVAAFRLLTDRDISSRDVLPGAVLSGVAFWILQSVSSIIISRYLQNAQSTYGNFGTVITILWWFYLQGIITLLGAQLNVVLKERLYPRGIVNPPDTEADRRAYGMYAKQQTKIEDEQVDTSLPAGS